MRRNLYPNRQARYVVGEELKQLLRSGTKVERNSLFMATQEEDVTPPKDTLEKLQSEDSSIRETQVTATEVYDLFSLTQLQLLMLCYSLNALLLFWTSYYPQN